MTDTRSPYLEQVDRFLALGDALFGVRDARVALILGVVHGLGLEQDLTVPREAAVAAARGGYALRRAEEDLGEACADSPFGELLAAMEAERSDLPHWEAMQIVAWEWVDDAAMARYDDLVDAAALRDDRERDTVLALVASAAIETFGTGTPVGTLSDKDARRAARFGYALRIAERSLPDDPERLLTDA